MLLLILLPTLLLAALALAYTLAYADPDRVLDDHYSYVGVEEQNGIGENHSR